MRRWLCVLAPAVLGACAPPEQEWVVEATRFRGVRTEVVEPGGYGSLLNVPEGKHRATLLPLDTVEFTWAFAAAPGLDVAPPIWLACAFDCPDYGPLESIEADLPDCPAPLPFAVPRTCRLGEDHQVRVGLGGLYTLARPTLTLILVASRQPDITPAACLERLARRPRLDLEPCIVALWEPELGPAWAALPFDPLGPAVPPEVLAQEADVNPDVVAFRVTRARGSARDELVVEPGASVRVRRGQRIALEPVFADGSAQKYWRSIGDAPNMPWSGELRESTEDLEFRAWFSAPVLDYDYERHGEWNRRSITWTVPHDVEPTTLFLDVRDDRSGRAFAELHFVPDDPA